MEGGWSQGEKVKALCGKGQETKVVLSLWEGMGGERGKSIHLTHDILRKPSTYFLFIIIYTMGQTYLAYFIFVSYYVPGTVLGSVNIMERKIHRHIHGTHSLVRMMDVN